MLSTLRRSLGLFCYDAATELLGVHLRPTPTWSGCRVKRVEASGVAILGILTYGWRAVAIDRQLPDDARLVDASFCSHRDLLTLVVESAGWPVVSEGCDPPLAEWTIYRDVASAREAIEHDMDLVRN